MRGDGERSRPGSRGRAARRARRSRRRRPTGAARTRPERPVAGGELSRAGEDDGECEEGQGAPAAACEVAGSPGVDADGHVGRSRVRAPRRPGVLPWDPSIDAGGRFADPPRRGPRDRTPVQPPSQPSLAHWSVDRRRTAAVAPTREPACATTTPGPSPKGVGPTTVTTTTSSSSTPAGGEVRDEARVGAAAGQLRRARRRSRYPAPGASSVYDELGRPVRRRGTASLRRDRRGRLGHRVLRADPAGGDEVAAGPRAPPALARLPRRDARPRVDPGDPGGHHPRRRPPRRGRRAHLPPRRLGQPGGADRRGAKELGVGRRHRRPAHRLDHPRPHPERVRQARRHLRSRATAISRSPARGATRSTRPSPSAARSCSPRPSSEPPGCRSTGTSRSASAASRPSSTASAASRCACRATSRTTRPTST